MIIKVSNPKQAIYDCFKLNNPEVKVDLATFSKIYSGYLKYIMYKLLDGYDIKLGSANTLGTLMVRGKKNKPKVDKDGNKVNGIPIDWGNSRKMWKQLADGKGITLQQYIDSTTQEERPKAYHFNDHSDGITNKIVWVHPDGHLDKYNFITTKGPNGNGRRLNKLIREEGKEYIEVVQRVKIIKPINNGQVTKS